MVSLKGRLPKNLQSKSTLPCEIVQILSLFRHGFIKKPKSKFNRNKKNDVFCSYVMDFENQILVLISLQMLFEGRYKTLDYFRYFLLFIFFFFYLFEKQNGAYCCLPSKDSLIINFCIQRMVSPMVNLFSTKCFLLVYIYIDLLKLKAYKLFEDSDADLSWLLF